MKIIIKFAGTLFISILPTLVLAQSTNCLTTLLFKANAWFRGVPNESAYALVWNNNGQDYTLFTVPFNNQQDQTLISNYCYNNSPVAVNIINGTGQTIAMYQSHSSYNSSQQAVNLTFPSDFTRIE